MDTDLMNEPLCVMPKKVYAEDRAWYFTQLAKHLKLREVEVRVALSNLFVLMAREGRRRS